MSSLKHLLWDTCVFGRRLTGDPNFNLDDIDAFASDAHRGRRTIYFSSIMLAEIGRPLLKSGRPLDILEYAASLGANFVQVETNPNISAMAGEIHAAASTNPFPKDSTKRIVSLGDALHLATALYLQDILQTNDVVFHTFDRGRGRTWEGRCVPMIDFERWFPPETRTPLVERVCNLKRGEPLYPQMIMDLDAVDRPRPHPSH